MGGPPLFYAILSEVVKKGNFILNQKPLVLGSESGVEGLPPQGTIECCHRA